MTSAWNVSSVTSMTQAEPPLSPAGAADGDGCGFAFSAERSTAPGSRMSVGRMLTSPVLHRSGHGEGAHRSPNRCAPPPWFGSGDQETVHRDPGAGAPLVVGAQHDQLQRVHLVGQAAEGALHAELRCSGVVVHDRLLDAVDVDSDLALRAAALGDPADARAAEGEGQRLTLDLGDGRVATGQLLGSERAPPGCERRSVDALLTD